jgi:hypothetical protein
MKDVDCLPKIHRQSTVFKHPMSFYRLSTYEAVVAPLDVTRNNRFDIIFKNFIINNDLSFISPSNNINKFS